MTANADAQEIEQAFMASWDRIEQFYVIFFRLGTFEDWMNLSQFDQFQLDTSQLEDLRLDFNTISVRWGWLKPIQGLIAEMRQHGYDRQLRAGQSVYRLILSRSRQHGLRSEQPLLMVIVLKGGGMTVKYWDRQVDSSSTAHPPVVLQFDSVTLHPEFEQLLNRLAAQSVD